MSCPICNCESYSIVDGVVNHSFYLRPEHIYKCDLCGVFYLSSFDHLSDKKYQSEYMKDYYQALEIKRYDQLSEYDKDLLRGRYIEIIVTEAEDNNRRYDTLKKYFKKKHLIDFGCGSGYFGLLAMNISKDVDFIETSEFFKVHYEDCGITVYTCINQVFYDADVITMFHVIEHLDKPFEVLRDIKSKLKKGGRLIIETPNSNDVLIEKSKPFRDFTFRSDHVILYNSDNIKLLLEKVGFEVESIIFVQRYNASNHVQWYKEGLPNGHNNNDEWSGEELNEAYTNELIRLGKTDTMLIIAK